VPLGFVAFKYDYRVAWKAFLFAALGNVFLAAGTAALRDIPPLGAAWDILYFTMLGSICTWIIAPPPGFPVKIPGSMRLLSGSCLGALLFAGIFFRAIASPHFSEYVNSLVDALISFQRSSGSDVVQNALLESLTAEMILSAMKFIMLRGGALISCVILFAIGRQISIALVRLTRRGGPVPGAGTLAGFRVYPETIWAFSVSLLLVVLTRMAKLEIPEILLWNILILCVILYFAQGWGILHFFLSRPSTPPFLRLLLSVLFIVLLFSPGINAILLAGVVLLGIAENWVPFRAPKSSGTPSTPEAGDDGN
jgi:hypothetical protein